MNSYSRNDWQKKSWINDLASSPKFAKDLTSLYVDDVLEATESKEFPTLEAAVSDLRIRVGLSNDESEMIHRVAAYKTNPNLFNAIENIKALPATKLASLIKAYTQECATCNAAPCSCGYVIDPTVRQAMNEIGIDKIAEMHDELVKTAGAEHLKEFQFKKSEESGEEAEETEEVAEKTASVKTATRKHHNENCSIPTSTKHHTDSCSMPEAEDKIKKEEKKMSSKKANIDKWMNYFKKESYFQNHVEAPSAEAGGKNVSNDPEKLGYPKEVEYSHTELNPSEGDVRTWEQNSFESAADRTKKNLGPAGEELKEKKELQRAKWNAFFKKQANNPAFESDEVYRQKSARPAQTPDEELSVEELAERKYPQRAYPQSKRDEFIKNHKE